jgi:hypothetical protein
MFFLFFQEQALKHLKQYVTLFSSFTSVAKSEMILINKMQVCLGLFIYLLLPSG